MTHDPTLPYTPWLKDADEMTIRRHLQAKIIADRLNSQIRREKLHAISRELVSTEAQHPVENQNQLP